MPRIFGYTRSSTAAQEISCKAQAQIIKSYVESKQVIDWKDYEFLGIFEDYGVSSQIPFAERPEGSKVLLNAQKGDIIIASHLSRVFRNTTECVRFLDQITISGVNFIVLDANFDTSTPVGLACLKIMAVFAELESKQTRERISSALQWKKENGLPTGGSPPYGWRIEGKRKHARFVPVPEDRDLAKYAAYLFYCHDMPKYDIYKYFRKNKLFTSYQKKASHHTIDIMLLRWRYFVIRGEWSKLSKSETSAEIRHELQQLSHEELAEKAYLYAPIQKPSDQPVPS